MKFKLLLNIITIIALVILIFFSRSQIFNAILEIKNLRIAVLLLIIPTQFFGYYLQANFYHFVFRSSQESVKLPIKTLTRVALELNFVNQIFPSGGVSGFSYLSLRLKKYGISSAQSTLAQTLRLMFTFLSFLLLLFLGMVVLSMTGSASKLIIFVATSITVSTLFGTAILIFIIGDSNRIKSFTAFLPKLLNKLVKIVFHKKSGPINVRKIEKMFNEMHLHYTTVRKNWKSLRPAFLCSLGMNICELLTIYYVYIAFDSWINPGSLIIAYAVANFAGLMAILPGGVGIYEALMTTILTTTGVNRVLALSATVVYRVLNMIIFLPIGYILYQLAFGKELLLESIEDDDTNTTNTNTGSRIN